MHPRAGIATGYELNGRGIRVRVPVWAKFFSTSSRPVVGPTQESIQWVPGALSSGVDRPWLEADYSPPSGTEVKSIYIYTSTPTYAFMA
jgi:hypothetical protein